MPIFEPNGKVRRSTGDISRDGLPAEMVRYGLDYEATTIAGMPTSGDWAAGSRAFADGSLHGCAIYVPRACTIYSLAFFMAVVPASQTPDQNNKVGLYTSDGTTLTLVASSASNPKQMYAPAGTGGWRILPLTTPYVAAAGVYWASTVSNWSAQSGSNYSYACSSGTQSAEAAAPLATAGTFRWWTLAAQNDLPSTQLWSGVTGATNGLWILALR